VLQVRRVLLPAGACNSQHAVVLLSGTSVSVELVIWLICTPKSALLGVNLVLKRLPRIFPKAVGKWVAFLQYEKLC